MTAVVAFYILFPAVILFTAYRYSWVNKIGPVVLCYIVGIIIGNIGILPEHVLDTQSIVTLVTVSLALPLMLFSMNVKNWSRLAGKTLAAMGFAILAVAIITFIGYMFLRHQRPDAWKISGMLIGVYTGGTPNLAAIKESVGLDSTTFIILHTYDTFLSLFYIIFVMTIAQKLFLRFLPAFKKDTSAEKQSGGDTIETIQAYKGLVEAKNWPGLGLAFGVSVMISAAGYGVSRLMPASLAESAGILTITSLGIIGSLWPRLNRIKFTFQLGMYIILVFSLVVGSMAKFESITTIHPALMLFVFVSIFGTMFLQAVFCWIARIDADTFIITSVSAIMSPPFVPVVAGSLKNEELVLSGLTTGIIGYALGNYLGVGLAMLYRAIGG